MTEPKKDTVVDIKGTDGELSAEAKKRTMYATDAMFPPTPVGVSVSLAILSFAFFGGMFWVIGLYADAVLVDGVVPEGSTAKLETEEMQLVRLIQGWCNVANAAIHVVFAVWLKTNPEAEAYHFMKGEWKGASGMIVVNLPIGLLSLFAGHVYGWGWMAAQGWNFMALVVSPYLVWARQIPGFHTWPYPAIAAWIAIYWCEMIAFFATCGWYALMAANDE